MGLGPSGSTSFLVEDPGSTGGGTPPSLWYSGWSETAELTTTVSARVRRPGAGDRRPKTTIRLLSLDGRWTDLGSGQARGIVHEQLTAGADRSGPTDASFTVRRDGSRAWSDIGPFTAVEMRASGLLVWGGRIDTAPGDSRSISVASKGRQYDLDLDLMKRYFVHSRLSDWRDMGTFPNAVLANVFRGGVPSTDGGAVTLGWGNGITIPAGATSGVMLDLGSGLTAKRIVVEWQSSNNDAGSTFYARASDSDDPLVTGPSTDAFTFAMNSGASGTTAGTFSTARRYVALFVYNASGGATSAETWLKIKAARVYADTAYESGNHSILKASDVVKVARTGAPSLSTSDARIVDSGLIDGGTAGIPHLVSDGYATPRSLMEAANAYHNWALGVDARGRVIFEPRSLVPVMAVGAWRGSSLSGLSSGSSDDVYNKVIVEGQDGAGNAISVVRTASAPALDRRGLTHTGKLTVGAVSSQAILERIGDVWLAEKARTPFRGTLEVGLGGARRIPDGTSAHPAELLLHGGRRIRFMQLVDPDTGGKGRDGVIASVRYDDEGTKATVQIDNTYSVLEPLLALFGLLQEQMVA